MSFAAARSEHPSPAEAAGEVVGEVLERLGPAPDVALVVAGPRMAEDLGIIGGFIRAALAPDVLLGCARSTWPPGPAGQSAPMLQLWAAQGVRAHGVRVDAESAALPLPAAEVARLDAERGSTLLLLGDGWSLPTHPLLASAASDRPWLTVLGGLVGSGPGPGSCHLLLDDEAHRDGAVGVLLPGIVGATVLAPAARPVGPPMIVTRAEGLTVLELAGRPALARVGEVTRALPVDDRLRFEAEPRMGVVVDESQPTFAAGDLLDAPVIGVDPGAGGVRLGRLVAVGTTIQLQVRDPDAAADHLRRGLAEVTPRAEGDQAALVLSTAGPSPVALEPGDTCAEMVGDIVGGSALALICDEVFAPFGAASHLIGDAVAALVLSDVAR